MNTTGIDPATAPAWPAPTLAGPVDAVVTVPGSKSASNRALVLAAIADGASTLTGVLDARDTRLMVEGVKALGNEVRVLKRHAEGNVDLKVTPHFMRGPATIDVGLAGTVMRFLPPMAALAHGEVAFDGDAAARRRPMATVIESLKELGVTVHDRGTGRLPFAIAATGEVRGGEVTVDASRSSQFISGLLLSAARFETGVTIHHVGEPIPSMPHVDMTIAMLAEHGIPVRRAGENVWHVDPHDVPAIDRTIEPDLSNAAPFLAAALVSGGRVRIPDWPTSTVQPGAAIVDLLTRMGATARLDEDGLTITGTGSIAGLDVDLRGTGELAPTIAALAALADGPSHLTGIAHLRGHETDRLAAISTEITALGGECTVTDDGLLIEPRPLHGGTVRTYSDHRMATFAAILGLRIPGIAIEDVATTGKTLPGFVENWTQMVETAR